MTVPSITATEAPRPGADAASSSDRPLHVHRRTGSARQRSLLAPRRLILYSHERASCPHLRSLFEQEFETDVVETDVEFSGRLRQWPTDAAVLCFCSARDISVDALLRLVALAGPIPVLACCRAYNPGFIHLAASRGVSNFLLCEMGAPAIRRFVVQTIRVGGLRAFLDSQCPAGVRFSPHVAKLVDEIVRAFPRRLTTDDASQRLGIKARRLQTLCREAFGRSFTHLLRLIWIRQALTTMQNTSLDNTEIALRLGYEDESSLARIFRKELGLSPSEARRRLTGRTPDELLRELKPTGEVS